MTMSDSFVFEKEIKEPATRDKVPYSTVLLALDRLFYRWSERNDYHSLEMIDLAKKDQSNV